MMGRGGSRTFKGGRGRGKTSAEGASFLGGSGGMLPQKYLNIRVSKMAISSILRKILFLFNTTFLLVDFVQIKNLMPYL